MAQYAFTLKDSYSAVLELLIKNLANIQAANDTFIELLSNIHGLDATKYMEIFDRRVSVNFKMILERLYETKGDAKSDIEKRIKTFIDSRN